MNKKVFLTLSVLAIIYWFLFDALRLQQGDTPSFIGGARLLFGLEGGLDYQSRLTKPLVLLMPGLMELLTGLHPKYTFLFQNLLCFYLCGIFIYKINRIIFKDNNMAYLGMLAYLMCHPFAVNSLFILSDTVGWFFGIISIYLILKYFSGSFSKSRDSVLIGCLIGLGCLTKESAIVGLIFFFSYVLVNQFPVSKKSRYILFSSLGFILPLAISFVLIDHLYKDSILDRILEAYDLRKQDHLQLMDLKHLFRVIDMYWFLFVVGLIGVFKILKSEANNYNLKSVLLAGSITLILVPIWPYFIDRIIFLVAPLLIVVVVFGIREFKQFGLSLVLIGGFFNVFSSFLIYKYDVHGTIVTGTIIFLTIMAIFLLILNKEKILRL